MQTVTGRKTGPSPANASLQQDAVQQQKDAERMQLGKTQALADQLQQQKEAQTQRAAADQLQQQKEAEMAQQVAAARTQQEKNAQIASSLPRMSPSMGRMPPFKSGGAVKGYAKGGSVSSASKRADGCAQRGKTKGRMI
jgi:FKBP-type peptidyl-prolyl cis-trans isomerase